MNKLLILCLFVLLACERPIITLKNYSEQIGFDESKPTILLSLENCSYCFVEYQEAIKKIDTSKFNLVIISSQRKKASMLAVPDNKTIFVDQDKLAMKLNLIKSLPVILLPSGETIEIFSPDQLLVNLKNNVP
ncbi:hypothetical protein [Arthrospiribacter ruber]|uniref:Uncharacterized protein n=1 Tax=Arthrospiribacter ruber TaxID=2487934 RepID=A0A951J4U2_9BACT|nr:hypothetical protein [Arthrospiribacter ruber]MBW3470072.1 hypothetical protein [Arthrospiribacter ruber]